MNIKQLTANFQALVKKLETKFEEEIPAVVEVVELAEATLTDGTIVKYDVLDVGGVVSVITEEGEVPAPDESHQLEDGTIITTVEGVITEVVAAEVAPAVTEEDEMFEQEFKKLVEQYSTLSTELKSVKAEFSTALGTIKEMTTILSEVQKVVELAAQEPAAAAAEKPKQRSVSAFKTAFK